MSRRLLLSELPGELRAAWLDGDDRLLRLRVQRADRRGAVGDLYLGRVLSVDRGLRAAFVEIGLARPALLPLARGALSPAEGRPLAVRVTRAPAADKGAKLAAAPDLAVPDGARPPLCLGRGDDPLAEAAAVAAGDGGPPDEILVDGAELLQRARAAWAEQPDLAGRLRLHSGPGPLFDAGLEGEIEALLQPQAAIPGGGSLLIEPVATLTAIDVNSGGRDGRGGPRAAALETDLAAAAEIARQIRLRDLSGLIVVDFLELESRAERAAVVEALRQALAGDPQPSQVQAMRPSGLVEMTRRRDRPPLHELLCARCGLGGGGWAREPASLAFELLRRAAAAPPAAQPLLLVAPAVGAALDGPAAAARAAVEARRGRPLALRVEPDRRIDDMEIVLG